MAPKSPDAVGLIGIGRQHRNASFEHAGGWRADKRAKPAAISSTVIIIRVNPVNPVQIKSVTICVICGQNLVQKSAQPKLPLKDKHPPIRQLHTQDPKKDFHAEAAGLLPSAEDCRSRMHHSCRWFRSLQVLPGNRTNPRSAACVNTWTLMKNNHRTRQQHSK